MMVMPGLEACLFAEQAAAGSLGASEPSHTSFL